MSNYALIKDGVVVATKSSLADGYILAPDSAECGDTFDGSAWGVGEAKRKSAISAEATSRIDSATGSDLRGLILKVAKGARLSRKEAKGQASAGEVAVLDHLDALASYAEAVRTEEARLLADTNLTVDDAVWPTEP